MFRASGQVGVGAVMFRSPALILYRPLAVVVVADSRLPICTGLLKLATPPVWINLPMPCRPMMEVLGSVGNVKPDVFVLRMPVPLRLNVASLVAEMKES